MNSLQPQSKTRLTEMQEKFLTALLSEECNGNARAAMTIAGYSPKYSQTELMRVLRDEIIDRCTTHLALNMPNAVHKLVGMLDTEMAPTDKDKLLVIREVLDRGGLIKKDKVEHSGSEANPIFIVPAKRPIKE